MLFQEVDALAGVHWGRLRRAMHAGEWADVRVGEGH